MSFLRLNGIAVPVAAGSAPSVSQEFIGKNRRALDGSIVAPRRTTKKIWKFATAPKTAAEALAFRDLIAGRGHVVSFDASFYTSKGMAPASLGAWAISAVSPKYGAAKGLFDGGSATTWAFFESGGPWTLSWWLNENMTGGWQHYVQTSAGGTWKNGVAGVATVGMDSVTAGVASFGSGLVPTGNGIDDIVALPYVVPSTWPAQMYGFGYAFGLLPRLTADGDYIEQNTRVSVLASESTGQVQRAAAAHVHGFGFELSEV